MTDEHTAVIEEVVADKGYHSDQVLVDFAALDLRTYIAEPDRGRRRWRNKTEARTRSTRIAGASVVRAGERSNADGVNDWNDPTPISTKPVACAGCSSAGTRTCTASAKRSKE